MRNYDEHKVTNYLRSKRLKIGMVLNIITSKPMKTITIPAHIDLGIKTLGKLDYLVNFCGYQIIRKKARDRKSMDRKPTKRKVESYFHNRRCHICKGIVKLYRLMKEGKYYLCKSDRCDYKAQVITGFFKGLEEEKIR